MDRDEYLAREIMGWTRSKTFSDEWKWFAPDGWAEYALDEWDPGKSWPQTGMILEEMEQDYYITILTIDRWDEWHEQFNGSCHDVSFAKRGSNDYGCAVELDMREAIATAAARAKGWKDGTEKED